MYVCICMYTSDVFVILVVPVVSYHYWMELPSEIGTISIPSTKFLSYK